MGIGPISFRLLVRHSAQLDLSRVMQVGRQNVFITPQELRSAFPRAQEDALLMGSAPVKYAEPLFKILGAACVESCDVNSGEGATHVFDLVSEVPATLLNSYTLVYDGGTSEHCFSPFHAIEHIFQMTASGGHAIFNVPANNLMGHGFWQYTPDFFFQMCRFSNGALSMVECYVIEESPFPRVYRVNPCDQTHPRHRMETIWPAWLFVVIKKNGADFHLNHATQSGYTMNEPLFENSTARVSGMRAFLKRFGGKFRWLEPIYYRFIQRTHPIGSIVDL